MHGVFGGMKVRAGAVGDFALDPFSFQDHDRFGSLGMSMGGDRRARGETTQKEARAGVGIMGKRGELNAWVGARLPEGGVGQTDGGEHPSTMPERFLSDN